jgi:hypothetical protein
MRAVARLARSLCRISRLAPLRRGSAHRGGLPARPSRLRPVRRIPPRGADREKFRGRLANVAADGIWTIPGARTKNHRQHVVPLPPMAQRSSPPHPGSRAVTCSRPPAPARSAAGANASASSTSKWARASRPGASTTCDEHAPAACSDSACGPRWSSGP